MTHEEAPAGPYDPGAAMGRYAVHRVVIRPSGWTIAIPIAGTLICLATGVGLLVAGIVAADMSGRVVGVVVGGLITLVSIGLCAVIPVMLRPRTYTFTDEALQGELHGRPLRVPWSEVAEVTIRARPLGATGGSFLARPWPMVWAFLYIELREGATIEGFAAGGRLSLPFWNRIPLIHSFAYGCRTFAGDQFRGVSML